MNEPYENLHHKKASTFNNQSTLTRIKVDFLDLKCLSWASYNKPNNKFFKLSKNVHLILKKLKTLHLGGGRRSLHLMNDVSSMLSRFKVAFSDLLHGFMFPPCSTTWLFSLIFINRAAIKVTSSSLWAGVKQAQHHPLCSVTLCGTAADPPVSRVSQRWPDRKVINNFIMRGIKKCHLLLYQCHLTHNIYKGKYRYKHTSDYSWF